MAIFPTRFRVMTICKFSPPYRSKPEYDQNDFEATIDLRQFLGEHLDTFCSELQESVKWFIDKLSLIRHDVGWVEREAGKVWPLLEGEYPAWVQIACDSRSADQDWRAPAWLDGWPAELPRKALLSTVRGGRLNVDRTTGILKLIVDRIKAPMEQTQRTELNNLRIRFAHEREAAHQNSNAVLESRGSLGGPEAIQLSAADENANAQSRAKELQHFKEVERRLYDLKKGNPRWEWEGLGNDPPAHVIEIRRLTAERDTAIRDLHQFGITAHDGETISAQLRDEWDTNWNRDLRQLAGIGSELPTSPAVSKTTSRPAVQTTRTADSLKGFAGLGKKKHDLHLESAKLTDRQHDCLSMKLEYELPVTQIASRLNIDRKTIDEHLKAAHKRLERDQNYQRELKRRVAHHGSRNESD